MAREVAVKTNTGPREVPAIKPANVQIEAGLHGRAVQVRLPAGVNAQDLHDWPARLWSAVQENSTKALRRFDDVRLIGHDETFLIPDAIVTDADGKSATLDFKRIVQLPNRNETFEDENYRIYFDGPDRFVIDRKSDRERLLTGFANVEQAKAEMHRALYRER